MENELYELQEMVRDGKRAIEREKERLTERMDQLNGFIRLAIEADGSLPQWKPQSDFSDFLEVQ